LTCGDSPRRIFSWLLELLFRWSHQPSKSLTCDETPRDLPLTFGIKFRWSWTSDQVVDLWWLANYDLSLTFGDVYWWSYHPSKSLTCGDLPRVFSLDYWRCWSMILSTIKVVYLWWLAKADISLTFENVDRWSYHPSKSLTFGDVDLWSYQPSKSLTCDDSPRRISPLKLKMLIDDPIIRPTRWQLEMLIYDPINNQSRWLVMTCQVGCPLDFWNYVSMILDISSSRWLVVTLQGIYPWFLELCFDDLGHPFKSLTCVDSPRKIYLWPLEMCIGDPII
jgi:hypothetical protein